MNRPAKVLRPINRASSRLKPALFASPDIHVRAESALNKPVFRNTYCGIKFLIFISGFPECQASDSSDAE
jgi:hypothetical protein